MPIGCLDRESVATRRWRFPILCLAGCVLTAACASSTQLTPQEPTANTQLLLARSLDRAIAQLDVGRLVGRRVDVELVAQGGSRDFALEFVKKRLRERGVVVSSDAPEQKVQVVATALGTNRGDTLLGIPAMVAPVVGVPTPEISIFKWVRNRGLVELELDTLEPKTGEVIEHHGPVAGSAKRDDFTLLLFINFTLTDAVPGQ